MKTLMAFGALLMCSTFATADPTPSYSVTGSITGPDGGGWDYARVDPGAHRLYVARSISISVFDTASGKEVGSIGTIAHGHAVVPVAGARLLVTSGDDATVRFLSAMDGHEVGRIAVGKKPDAAILSNDGRTAYVMNAASGTISVIDIGSMRVIRTIAVKPALEYAALAHGTLFVNDEDANELEVVNVATGAVEEAIPLPGCDAPSGLAYDAASERLVAACANGRAAVIDAKARKVVGAVEIGHGPDAVILDAARRRAFIPCGQDGVLDILSLDGPAIRRIGRIRTATGARTGALDPTSGTIYLPTAAIRPSSSPGGRPATIPGTFRVLIVRPSSMRS